MQMSVLPHLNMYGQIRSDADLVKKIIDHTSSMKKIEDPNAKAVVESKSDANIKVYSSNRQKKLLKMSGQVGNNEPFRAPVYTSYRECIKGLYRQGVLGFYKGNLYRQVYGFFSGLMQVEVAFKIKEYTGRYGFINHLIGAIVADTIFHPFHLIESRYILQNRIPAFSTYKSSYTLLMRGYGEIYNGAVCHLPKNICLAFAGFNFFASVSPISFLAKEMVFNALAYPFITVMRRIEAQSTSPGMIPKRYYNSIHCFNVMKKEEGIRGFYRGFVSFSIGMAIHSSSLKITL